MLPRAVGGCRTRTSGLLYYAGLLSHGRITVIPIVKLAHNSSGIKRGRRWFAVEGLKSSSHSGVEANGKLSQQPVTDR